MGKIINERILEIVTTLTSPHTVSWQTAIALMQSNAMFAFVSVLSTVKLCSIMQILASSIKQRSKTSFYLWDFRCSISLTLFENERVDLCDLCVLSILPLFYNDSNLDHKRCQWNLILSVILANCVWKLHKMSHSKLRAKRAKFTFWVDKYSLKMPKMQMVNFGEFLKTWSIWSNSDTRQANFNWTKIGGKCQYFVSEICQV